ncbi:MAG: PDZ domain-containing protein [Chloroflexi bacterium]|nr:PDZ domain-containing protein [Chloroflexota bacterium]
MDLVISLNALDHQVRWEVLRDRDLKQRAVNCLPILEKHQVPFVVSLVAWPTVPLHDLEVASEFADQHGAAMIRVNLPGYSKYFSQFKLFDTWEYWPQVTDLVRDLRTRVKTPIFISPALYEERHYGETLNGARILGTVRNSPAERAGVQYNDTLVEVNGVGVESRGFAKALLNLAFAAENVALKVQRGGETIALSMTAPAETAVYPYEHHANNLYGIVMGDGLSPRYMRDIAGLIAQEGARDVVIATSTLAKPAFDELMPRLHSMVAPDVKLRAGIPANNFLGGNIMAGDLMQVDDFIDFVRGWSDEHGRPDLVLIPSSPFDSYGWRRDMMGRVFLDIERATGVPVRLIRNDRIWY